MDTVKDSIANVTTIAGAASAMIQWNEVLTFFLIATGIILNIQRIIAQRRRENQDK
jgi:hydroxyethylthiazole kinase-like sugar kinase family protein